MAAPIREQILANALHAFPAVVKKHLDHHHTTLAKAHEIFDVVVMPHEQPESTERLYIAALTHGEPTLREIAITTEGKATWEEAIVSLLEASGSMASKQLALVFTPKRKLEEGDDFMVARSLLR